MPPQPRATYASRAKLGFVLQALMKIKNFLALFRKNRSIYPLLGLLPSCASGSSPTRRSRGSAFCLSWLRTASGFRVLPTSGRDDPSWHPFRGYSKLQSPVPDRLLSIAGDRRCARREFGQSARFHNVSLGAAARTTLRSSPPNVPRASLPADSVHEWRHLTRHIQPGFRLHLVLDQQPFGVEPVPEGISRNSLLADGCSWSRRLPRIPPVRFDFSGRDSSFSTRFRGDFLPRLSSLVSIVVGRQSARGV